MCHHLDRRAAADVQNTQTLGGLFADIVYPNVTMASISTESRISLLPPPSYRKRKAPDDNNGTSSTTLEEKAGIPPLLVAGTKEMLMEMRRRMGMVVEGTVHRMVAKTKELEGVADHSVKKKRGDGGDSSERIAKAYLKHFQAMVAAKAESMCDTTRGAELELELEELAARIAPILENRQRTIARLAATRARVSRLAVSTCSDALRISNATEPSALSAGASSSESKSAGQRVGEAGGGEMMPVGGGASGSASGGGRSTPADTEFSGLEEGVLEPKVSMLIGAIAELPGPLKAVLRELPELTSSLTRTVQSVEAAIGMKESKTEALLAKAPPAPLGNRGGRAGGVTGAAGIDAGGLLPPPAVARAAARATRVEQAKIQRAGAGRGASAAARLGEIVRS